MRRFYLVGLLLALGLLVALPALARTPLAPTAGEELSWYTIDGGGALNVSGGTFSLGGAVGQADAGTMSGGSFSLAGGFWNAGVIEYHVYLPLVLRSS